MDSIKKDNLDKRLHIKIHPAHYDWIKEQSKKFNISMGRFVRDVIMIAYMEDHSPQWGREEHEQYLKDHPKTT